MHTPPEGLHGERFDFFFALDTFLLPQVTCGIDSGPGVDLYIYYFYIRVFRIVFPPGGPAPTAEPLLELSIEWPQYPAALHQEWHLVGEPIRSLKSPEDDSSWLHTVTEHFA